MATASPLPASPGSTRRLGDSHARSSSGCPSSCRSPKRARASPSVSSERTVSSRPTSIASASSLRGGLLGRSGSYGKKKLSCPPECDTNSRQGHASTSPCRTPKSSQWPNTRSQRRRESSVPLLSRTLSYVSLSHSTPPSDIKQQSPLSPRTAASASTPPALFETTQTNIPSAQTPRRVHSLRRANTPAHLKTDNLQQPPPHTAPMPVIHSLLGSPFATTRPQLYPYELASPTWIAHGGTDDTRGQVVSQAHGFSPEWRPDKDTLPELFGASSTTSPGFVPGRNNSCASDDGSCTSASSFFSSGRVPTVHSRPSFVTIWGDDADTADHDDDHHPSTPNRKLFVGTGNLDDSLLMSSTRHDRSSGTSTSPLTGQRVPRSPSTSSYAYDHSPTRPLVPLSRIVTAAPAENCMGVDFGAEDLDHRMGGSARKAASQAPLPMDNNNNKAILNQRRISEPVQHSSGDSFAAFLARCGGERATRSDASPHGRERSTPPPMPRSDADEDELSPLRAIRPPAFPATAPHSKPPGFAPSPSTSLQSIKTRLDRLKGTPKTTSGPTRSQSTRVSASARAARPTLRRGVTEPQAVPQVGTPVSQLFGDDKPSPAAFASAGLVKKRGGRFSLPRFQDITKARTWSPVPIARHSSMALTKALAPSGPGVMDSDTTEVLSVQTQVKPEDSNEDSMSPIRPIRGPFRRSVSGHAAAVAGLHQRVPSAASDIATSPLRRTHARVSSSASSIGGLRRKGSFMFNSAASITSDTVSEKGLSPATPTKPLPFSAIQAKFAVSTPSPTVATQQYPFARRASVTSAMSIETTTSPTVSPFRPTHAGNARVRQLGRAPIARTSNPMLAATFRAHGSVVPTTPAAVDTTVAETYMSDSARVAGAGRFERDFTLVQALGSGEFSCVWKVRCKADGELWAVKTGRPYTGARNRLRQLEEVSILRQLSALQHPHVVQYSESWEQAGRLYIRTELADCGDLATYLLSLGDTGGLDEGRVWKALVELTSAVEFIHGNDILHLDFKPSNILVMRDGRLKVADFGMSMFFNRDVAPIGLADGDSRQRLAPSPMFDRDIEGDREYLAPELLRDAVPGPEADVFSLGILTLEAALNVVLPSNGDAWVKLRNDDFSDLDEHYIIRGLRGLHGKSMDTFDCIGEAPAPTISLALVSTLRHMMAADPGARITVQQLSLQLPMVRARTAMYNDESPAGPALVEEEEGWTAYLLGDER